MIYPLLPVFLAGVLGTSSTFIGAIEGIAETTASLLKLVSGWWSDKMTSRKPFVVIGYLIASVARPFTAATRTASQVLAIRVTDRIGKGLRTSPRDALLADVWGYQPVFILSALAGALTTLCFVFWVPDPRRKRAQRAAQTAIAPAAADAE